MIVQLNHYQSVTISARVPELHATAMKTNRRKYGRRSHQFDLPAICWRQILDHLLKTCYGPMGGKLKGSTTIPVSVYSGIAKIQEAVSRMEHHPALHRQAIIGVSTEIVPAWILDDKYITCYPIPNGRFVLLEPHAQETRGRIITTWREVEPSSHTESMTYSEDFHLLFVGQVVSS